MPRAFVALQTKLHCDWHFSVKEIGVACAIGADKLRNLGASHLDRGALVDRALVGRDFLDGVQLGIEVVV